MENYIENYNKYRKALQEKGLVVFPVKGTTVDSYKDGKSPYNNPKYSRFNSFHSFKDRPYTQEESEYYFSSEKGEVGLAVLFGEVKGRTNLYLVGLDVDRMIEGTIEDFSTFCVENGLAIIRSASKGLHVYGYSNIPFPDAGVEVTIGRFKIGGDLWGNGGKYFVTPPTKLNGGEYKTTESFIESLFLDDFKMYPKQFIDSFVVASQKSNNKILDINRVPVSSTDVDGFIKAFSQFPITKKEGRHNTLLNIAKSIYKRIYNTMSADEAISLVEQVLIGLKKNGVVENGDDKSDQELTDIATYCYGYRKKWEDEISTPEFQKIIDGYRSTGTIPNNVDDYKQKYIKKYVKSFDVQKHKDAVENLKKLKGDMYLLDGKALTDAKNKAIMLKEYIYNESYQRILFDKPHLKYDPEGDRLYDYSESKGIYYELEKKLLESEVLACLTSYGLDSHATRAKAQDTIARMLISVNKFVPTKSSSVTCVGNGLLNIDTGEFTQWTPSFVTTTRISTRYNPDVTIEGSRFEKFLEEVTCGDKEQSRILQQFAGYLLSPTTKYQKALLLTGEGSNGKGVFTRALKGVVGNEAYSVMKAEDINKNFGVAHLQNKRVNICDETTDKYLDTHILKSLISGEDQICDVKHKNQIHFTPEVKVIMTVNDLPTVSDTSYGFYRRFIPISFDAKFSPELGNIDPELSSKLENEAEIIFIWALEGYKDLKKQGEFSIKDKNINALIDYKIGNDITERFVINNFKPSAGNSVTLFNVYQAYREYSRLVGKLPKNIGNFSKDLRRTAQYGSVYSIEERRSGHDQVKISGIILVDSEVESAYPSYEI